MKSIGSLLFLYGVAAIIFGFTDMVPVVLTWIYNWGETTAWIIKIGLVVLGGALYLIGARKQSVETNEE